MVWPFLDAIVNISDSYVDNGTADDHGLMVERYRSLTNSRSSVFRHKRKFGAINYMANYTFYKEETQLMFLGNVASAGLVVVGIFSNFCTLGVLDSTVFKRTSCRWYLKWVCWFNLLGLLLGCLRHHTFLLDFEDNGAESNKRRIWGCTWLLWFIVEIEHCTTGSLILLCWNRVWSQRNVDRGSSEVDAMRTPILLNVCCLLLAVVPTSLYIEAFDIDSTEYNMTYCSFSFIHPYGSPLTQMPIKRNANKITEFILLVVFVVLLVEMTLKSFRARPGGRITIADLVGHLATPHRRVLTSRETSMTETVESEHDTVGRMTKERCKAQSFLNSDDLQAFGKQASIDRVSPFDERDRSMTYMIVMYIVMYILMGAPARLGPYFFEKFPHHFPLMTMLSLLRQLFHAGTLMYLFLGSDLIRETIADLNDQLPAVQYTSSTALFDPEAGQQDSVVDRRRSHRYASTIRSPPEPSVAETGSTLGHIDRLELGVRRTDPTPNRAVVMTMRSPSQPKLARNRLSESTFVGANNNSAPRAAKYKQV